MLESKMSRRNQWTLRKVNQWLLEVKLDGELEADDVPIMRREGIRRLDLQNVQVVGNVFETTGTMDTRLDVRWW